MGYPAGETKVCLGKLGSVKYVKFLWRNVIILKNC